MRGEFVVHESALDQCLTVVEHAVNLQCGDVLTECGELTLLYGTHLSLGIKYIHMDARYAQEAIGHSRPSVARGGHQHIHQPLLSALADEVTQQAGHETRAHILEGQRGSVEEFE